MSQGTEVALMVRTVDLDGCTDEAAEGTRQAVARVSTHAGVILIRKLSHPVDDRARRYPAIKFAADSVGRGDHTWRVLKGRNPAPIEGSQKLIVLIRVCRCCTDANDCEAD